MSVPGTPSVSAFVPRHRLRDEPLHALEARLVQRPDLADLWTERLSDSLAGGARQHLALVGGEGLGKTHLLAVVAARLTAANTDKANASADDAQRSAAVAWLPEDEPTASWSSLLLLILRALRAGDGQAFPLAPPVAVAETDEARRGDLLAAHLLHHLGGRTLVVIVERLDDVLAGLGDEGSKRWRAFLQEQRVVTLASTPRLTDELTDRQRPFFNFFQLEHLAPLSVATSVELVARLAEPSAPFARSPTGAARIAALGHLLGTAPRTLVELADGLSAAELDALLPAVTRLIDRRTPRCRELLRRLPSQQREIVAFLCRQPRTVPVKAIAEALALTPQTAASQLKGLRDKGYVVSSTQGRESRYEVADTALPLGVEVAAPAREPLAARVAFVRAWFEEGAAHGDSDGDAALQAATGTGGDRAGQVAALVADAEKDASLPALAVAAVRGLGDVTIANSAADARAWSDAWASAAADHAVLAPAARMLEVGLAWLAARADRALLDLSHGERALLREALGLPPA